MVRETLKRRIVEALAESSSGRDALRAVLRDLPPLQRFEPIDLSRVEDTAGATTSSWVMLPELAADELSTTSTSLQVILDTVKDAILTVDRGGRILSVNTSAARVFCENAETMAGKAVTELIPSIAPPESTLEKLATRFDDPAVDLSPVSVEARRADGTRFTAEMTISRAEDDEAAEDCFVLCMRDVTERIQDIEALRDSEARYRALVENAPDAIVVLDVDDDKFIDANENAVRLFKATREKLLSLGPAEISPEYQPDGLPSFGLVRGYIDRALKGGRPVFEWMHCDLDGQEIPCEVRFIRLPASRRRLIRASIIDVAARKRADTLAFGERKLLELIVANAPLERTLNDAVRLAEQLHPDLRVVLMRLDERVQRIRLAACGALSGPLRDALHELPVGLRAGACGAAASLGRQVVITDIMDDAMWAALRDAALVSGVRSCCSTPIVTTGDRIHGTLAIYFRTARSPTIDELDLVTRLTQIAGIAIRRKQDETALRASESRFRNLFDNVVDGVFQIAEDGELISANPAFVRLLGYDSLDQMSNCRLDDFCVDLKDRERLVVELTTHGRVRNYEYRLRRRNGSIIVVVENSRIVRDDKGQVLYCEGTITDVTQRKAAERALFKEKERAQVTLKSIGDAVVTTDAAGRVDYLNPVAEQLTGWERRLAQGKRIEQVVHLKDDVNGDDLDSPVLRCLREGHVTSLVDNVVLVSRDGTSIAIQDSAAPIQDRDGNIVGAVMVFHDVSHERQLHRKLSYYASHDSLTGLINRREFEERVSGALRAVKQGAETDYALLYMDLDQFKVVNDTCGHAAGDLLLRQLAEVLQARVRTSDVVARLGGDEFAVLLNDCPVERATEVADVLREAVEQFRFAWRDGSLQVGVSIGIVPVQRDSEGVGSLLSAADVACYAAKDLGRNRIHVYEEGDAAQRHEEMQWVARINRAREDERLELYYQPIVPIGPTRDVSRQFELLLRMRDEQGELVAPAAFLPAAERYNLMPSVDRWVIHEVLENLVYGGGAECEPYTLAINLSGTTLNDARFLDFLLAELKASNAPEGAVCFEITETAAIANLETVVQFMRTLKARGCRFSLDDFGTGLSSLTYLKNLPVDYVKIDGQFIRNVTKDAADESVVEAIARMASAFEIKTIAERVESREVLVRLGQIGISYAQGFYIAVPQPVAELPIRAQPTRVPA